MNAVRDALQSAGGTDVDMPATPERIWRALLGQTRTATRTKGETG
jgi:CO/xanthine dehydrogenase Mo-binding subunit